MLGDTLVVFGAIIVGSEWATTRKKKGCFVLFILGIFLFLNYSSCLDVLCRAKHITIMLLFTHNNVLV